MISFSKVSAIFNFQITWASNPISLANWLIWLSPIHTFTAHGEESAFRGQKYQTWPIFSSLPCVAKLSRLKLRRTREETAEQTALPGNFLSCFFFNRPSLDKKVIMWKLLFMLIVCIVIRIFIVEFNIFRRKIRNYMLIWDSRGVVSSLVIFSYK